MKIIKLVLSTMLLNLLLLIGCGDNTTQASSSTSTSQTSLSVEDDSKYQISETKWKEVISKLNNYAFSTTIDDDSLKNNTYIMTDKIKITDVNNEPINYFSKEEDKTYLYSLDNNKKWIRTENPESLDNILKNCLMISFFIDKYNDFTFNSTSKLYELEEYKFEKTELSKIKIGFKNEVLNLFELNLYQNFKDIGGIESNSFVKAFDFNKVNFTLPTITF